MNKNVLKVGALALGLFAFGALLNGTSHAENGQVSLTINSGTSQCIYGTSLDLGSQAVKFNAAYTFSGDFTSEFRCTDYIGVTSGWSFNIASSDLSNGKGNTIASGHVSINHAVGALQGDSSCVAGAATGTTRQPIATTYTIMERKSTANGGTDGVCELAINKVSLKVDVDANQAPGSYVGTLTLDIPNF